MTHMIGATTLDKPAVGVSYTKSRVTIVGERCAVVLPMSHDAISSVKHHSHWEYHDALYHADEEHPGQSCELCEEQS